MVAKRGRLLSVQVTDILTVNAANLKVGNGVGLHGVDLTGKFTVGFIGECTKLKFLLPIMPIFRIIIIKNSQEARFYQVSCD